MIKINRIRKRLGRRKSGKIVVSGAKREGVVSELYTSISFVLHTVLDSVNVFNLATRIITYYLHT